MLGHQNLSQFLHMGCLSKKAQLSHLTKTHHSLVKFSSPLDMEKKTEPYQYYFTFKSLSIKNVYLHISVHKIHDL